MHLILTSPKPILTTTNITPRYDFDLPILALDLVVAGGRVTLAVADACPLAANLRLPNHYMKTVVDLQVCARVSACTCMCAFVKGGRAACACRVCTRGEQSVAGSSLVTSAFCFLSAESK